MSLSQDEKYDLLYSRLFAVIATYKPIRGITLDVLSTGVGLQITVNYRYGYETVPYAETVPAIWIDMDEAFVKKNCEIMLRYLIKRSFSVEIERIFGYSGGGFNPL